MLAVPFLSCMVAWAMRIPPVSPVTALLGCTGTGCTCLGGCEGFLFGGLDGLGGLGLGWRVRSGEGGGSVFSFSWTGAGLGCLGGEDAGVECALARRQRQRRDHGGLNGSGSERVFAPVAAVVREQGPGR